MAAETKLSAFSWSNLKRTFVSVLLVYTLYCGSYLQMFDKRLHCPPLDARLICHWNQQSCTIGVCACSNAHRNAQIAVPYDALWYREGAKETTAPCQLFVLCPRIQLLEPTSPYSKQGPTVFDIPFPWLVPGRRYASQCCLHGMCHRRRCKMGRSHSARSSRLALDVCFKIS